MEDPTPAAPEAPSPALMPAMSIAEAIEARGAILGFTNRVLEKDTDYGEIPGTEKPTLYQPGAEKFAWFFGLYVDLQPHEIVEDWTGQDHEGEPLFAYTYRATAYRGDHAVATAYGSDNTWGARYRYRWVRPDEIPQGTVATMTRATEYAEPEWAIRRRTTTGPYGKPPEYWDRLQRAISDGTAIKSTKPGKDGKQQPWFAVVGEAVRIPNPDVMGQAHTCAMIAQKRAFVACVRRACALGDLFTQDVEELAEDERIATGANVGAPVANVAADVAWPVIPSNGALGHFDTVVPVPYWSASGVTVPRAASAAAGNARNITLRHLIETNDAATLTALAGMPARDAAAQEFASLAGQALAVVETGELPTEGMVQ